MALPEPRADAGTDPTGGAGEADDDLESLFADATAPIAPVRVARRAVVAEPEPEPDQALLDGDGDGAELLDVLDEPIVVAPVEYEVVDGPRRGRLPRGRVKARKVHRIIRYVSPWSVFKVSLLFYLCLWMIVSIAGVILWRVALASGTISQVEEFLAKLFAEESFMLDGRQMFRATAISGVIIVFAGTAFTVLMALLFNVISDVTGGIRMTVLELESARRDVRRSRLDRAEAREARRGNGRA